MAAEEPTFLLDASIEPISDDPRIGILKLMTNAGAFEMAVNREGAEGLVALLVEFLAPFDDTMSLN